MASCPHPSEGGHAILAGPVCHSLSRAFDSGEEQIQSGNDWNPLWCPGTFFFVFSLWVLRDDAVLALPEAGSSAIPSFFELPHILLGAPFWRKLAGHRVCGMQPRSMTNTATQGICQGWQMGGFSVDPRHTSCSLSQCVHTPCLKPPTPGKGLGHDAFVR